MDSTQPPQESRTVSKVLRPVGRRLWVWGMVALLLAAPGFAGADKKTDPDEHQAEEHHAEGHHAEEPHAEEPHAEEPHAEEHHEGDGEEGHGSHGKHSSRLSDEKIPLQLEGFPERPKPLIEWGEPFLGTGTLDPGIQLPTGAVWQPSLLMFGTLRTALQSIDSDSPGGGRITEWANRLDLFFNLQLSGSERLVVGFRPFDGDDGFSSYFFEHPSPGLDGEFNDSFDGELESLYFEGDFGEIFPNLDQRDFGSLDIGFSVGRQPLFFQEGLLINDTLDAIGITRNTLLPRNTSNFRATFLYAWDNVNAGTVERKAKLYALLTSTDFPLSTVDLDIAYVEAEDLTGNLLVAGLSAVQRLGKTNASFRLLSSTATDEETTFATDGLLFLSELSWVPPYSHDLVYFNSFWAVDHFSAAANGPATGGPLGRAGINVAAVGLGSYGAALSSVAEDVAGFSVGYQKFFDHTRKQLLFEVGGRFGTRNTVGDSYAATVRYQSALLRHYLLVVDAFVGNREFAFGGSETLYGGRLELRVKF